MKRIFNKLLVISLVCSILSVLLCIISIGNFDSYTLDAIDEMQSNNNTDDVSGYANLMKVSLSMFLDVGGILGYFIFVVLIPGLILFVIVILQAFARLFQIGNEKKWKNIVSRILSYISIFFQVLVCIVLILDFFRSLSVNKILLIVVFILNIISIVMFFYELSNIKKLEVNNANLKS